MKKAEFSLFFLAALYLNLSMFYFRPFSFCPPKFIMFVFERLNMLSPKFSPKQFIS